MRMSSMVALAIEVFLVERLRTFWERLGQPESLSEIDSPRHKINNLRKYFGRQVIDSSFRNSCLRQAPDLHLAFSHS